MPWGVGEYDQSSFYEGISKNIIFKKLKKERCPVASGIPYIGGERPP